mmetsp:Transcript_15890/g.24542  ORF Transcript_15890/g.24542 Transcript_15890/m.24542 type:complete len:652 (+) Transcript_15890:80-2035(+)
MTPAASLATTLILLSVLSSAAASSSSPLPSAATTASTRLTNDDGSSTLRYLPSSPSFKTPVHTTSSTSSSLILINQLRGGGWKNKNDEEYEYYEEEYYDEYDDDEYAEYYDEPPEEEVVKPLKANKKSTRSAEEEDEDDYNYVLGTPATNNRDNAKKQNQGGSKLFGFGASNKSTSSSKNTKTKKEKKSRQFMTSTDRASRASFVPSLRAPHYSARGGGHSLSGTTAAITALFSRTTSILVDYISTLSTFVMALLQPIGASLNSMAYYTYSTLYHWIILSFQLLRDVVDMIWYGPAIDGITTTGVMSRYGGLQSILFGSSLSTAVTTVVGVGLISWMMNAALTSSHDDVHRSSGSGRMFRPWTWLRFGRRFNMIDEDDEEEEDDIDANPHFSLEPPTVDEELEFISRTFKSANPTSKQRISETIVTSNQGLLQRLTNRRRGNDQQSGSNSPRRQRKMTVKSIQKWWKRDSNNMANGGQPINIIKPRKSNYSSKNKNPSINQLQNQLQKSEQERYQLQNDVQKLQLRLQKAHSDARNIASQNKWLEKQTSRADQILSRAVEVERKKANEEVERVRGEMKGVLERERLMMRGNSNNHNGIGGGRSMIGGGNDVELNRGPTRRVMDGVKIVRDVDDYDEDDMLDERGRPPWRAM